MGRITTDKNLGPQKRNRFLKTLKRNHGLLLMVMPAILYVFVFSYIPMVGIILAFEKYSYQGGIFHSEFVGFDNFRALIIGGKLGLATRNTLLYNVVFIFLAMILEMGIAILLNELRLKRFKKVAQTFMFLPHFISWVVVGAIVYNIFNYEQGVLNHIVTLLGGEKIDVYNKPGLWPFILTALKMWKEVGYGSVVYLAAITGLDQEVFEAAAIDGANEWQKIRFITIPSLVSTATIMVLLAIGGIFRGDFGLFYQTVKTSQILQPYTEIIDTYVFKLLMSDSSVGRSAAAGLYQSVMCFATIMFSNWIVRKVDPDRALY